jgi:hypothetical protein
MIEAHLFDRDLAIVDRCLVPQSGDVVVVGTVVPTAGGFEKSRTWSTKFEMRSPRYTTSVAELPVTG